MSVLNDVGVRMDDKLDDAHRRLAAHGGAKLALRSLSKGISGLAEQVKKDMDSGDLPDDPLKVAEYVNRMIERAAVMAASAAQHQENLEITATGSVQAFEEVVKLIKKDVDAEAEKMRRLAEAIQSGEIIIEDDVGPVSQSDMGRPTGVKPGMSIAQQRKAEEAAAKATQEEPEEPSSAPAEEAAPVEEKAKKRKRGRPKKSDKKG